jgi:splicing factor 3A subunit 1
MSTQNVDAVAPEATVVIPPPEIRKLADTTADYVAKNGPSFEVMVMEKESSNAKFSFLKKDDLYRAYYD